MAQIKEWSKFGWQGVTVDVPLGWELRRFNGNRAKGYARLADENLSRLEIRWEKLKRGVEFDKLVKNALAQIEKQKNVEIERHTRMAELQNKDVETFTTRPTGKKGGPHSYNIIAACRECGRIVMIRLLFMPGENMKAVATRVFESMVDHSYDGADVWAAYGLEFAVPETVGLDEALIYPGSIDFRFRYKHDRIDVARIALASTILKHVSLGRWFTDYARKRFKKVSYKGHDTEIMGHQGLELSGRLKGIGALLPRLIRRQRYLCRLWHCEKSDKICLYSVLAKEKNFDRFASHYDRVVSHR
jgi:hypothetical protein